MSVETEQEMAVIYGIYKLGPWVYTPRLVNFILENDFLKPSEGETDPAVVRAKFRRAMLSLRTRLREKGQVIPNPNRGVWELTNAGKSRLFQVARKVAKDPASGASAYSEAFLQQLVLLGTQLSDSPDSDT